MTDSVCWQPYGGVSDFAGIAEFWAIYTERETQNSKKEINDNENLY